MTDLHENTRKAQTRSSEHRRRQIQSARIEVHVSGQLHGAMGRCIGKSNRTQTISLLPLQRLWLEAVLLVEYPSTSAYRSTNWNGSITSTSNCRARSTVCSALIRQDLRSA